MIDGVAAANWLAGHGTVPVGYCLKYVWLAYKAQGASTGMSAGTAYQAWGLSDGKRPGDRNPPPGAAVWWGRRYDGNLDGDVTISLGGGRIAATDWPTGRTGITTIDQREAQIGREYLGWTSSIFDCPISLPGIGKDTTAAPAADTSEEDIMRMIRDNDRGSIFFNDEMGADHILDFISPDIETGEFVAAAQAAFPTTGVNARQWDIANAIAVRRWDRKRAQIVADTVSALTPVIEKAVADALGKA